MDVGVGEGRNLANIPTALIMSSAPKVARRLAVQAAPPIWMSCGVTSIARSAACLAREALAVDKLLEPDPLAVRAVLNGVACKSASV